MDKEAHKKIVCLIQKTNKVRKAIDLIYEDIIPAIIHNIHLEYINRNYEYLYK